jgi:hypothetical protein
MPPGKTCTIKLISNTGHWDTTFTVQTNSFSFTVPQPNRLNPVRVEVKTSDGYEVEVWTNSGVCSSLPLKLVDWKLEPIGDNKGLLTLVVEDVTGVSHINIMASVLGRTLQIVATLKPDNYNYQKTYTATIDLNNPK